jgi:glycine cleavage system H protein
MPANGTVLQVNEELRADPSLANTDPEGKGWFCKVQLSDLAELDGLMDASTYAGFAG